MPEPKFAKPWRGIPREEVSWNPIVDEDACIGCGTCVTACGRSVYRFDFEEKKAVVVDPLNCMVGCMTCANTCPTSAIHFPSLEAIMDLQAEPAVHQVIEDDLLARRVVLEIRRHRPSPDRVVQLSVTRIERIGSRNMVVELRPFNDDADALCQFTPGQYVELWIPDSDYLSRAYSIGGAPRDDGSVEVHLRQVPEGRFSEYAFGSMREGDVLRARGPLGVFRVSSPVDVPLLFVARGTGFAPIKAMIEQQLLLTPDRDIVLFWGVTDSEDFYEFDVIADWASTAPGFAAVLTARHMARDFRAPEGVAIEEGTVYDAIARTTFSLAARDAYVAGPRKTVNLVVRTLRDKGLEQDRIQVDTYGD
jgi:CDP-4-dehydro-6-deoxyglucose reductase